MSASPRVLRTIAEVRAAVDQARSAGARIALVPTMGALHDGHLALVRRADELADLTVVSIFVNPLQFGPGEDLDRYPRVLEQDLAALEPLNVPVVFAPAVAEMYPAGPQDTRVTAGPTATLLEGATRPGHFDGMLTVVAKLLNIVRPDTALFGQKDAQQLFLVRRMVAELNLPVAVEAVPIVRERGGLALSSRNRYLSPEQAHAAGALAAALGAAAASARHGLDAALAAARSVLDAEPLVRTDYFAVVDPDTFQSVDAAHRGPALALVAAYLGTTRLIDNRLIALGEPGCRPGKLATDQSGER
jgi:pantoate--beta-alanine ligase